ncbi:MAG: glycosyltransferase family 2 protein [Candidatus Caenarcaniphilales bacterium]|nr:glycosyltransferase family 2 protein [Candidatus Caenarcaniphilales bacterium]
MTCDNSRTIGKCLKQAQKLAKEVIVIDYGSEDLTLGIAEKYTSDVYRMPWTGAFRMKNQAVSMCKNSWILHICPDEILSNSLIKEIKKFFKEGKSSLFSATRFSRKFYLGEQHIRWGGFYPDYQLRLFKKDNYRFKGYALDESAEIWDESSELYVTNSPKVHTFKSSFDYVPYIDFEAMENFYHVSAKSSYTKMSHLRASLESSFRFLMKYIIQLGLLDGNLGYKIAKLESDSVWLQYESYLEDVAAEEESNKTSIRSKKVKVA